MLPFLVERALQMWFQVGSSYAKTDQGVQVGHKVSTGVLVRGRQREIWIQRQRWCDDRERCYAVGFEDGSEGHKPRNARTTALRAEKGREMNSPLEPLKECGFCFNPVRPFRLLASRTVKSRNLCCFKPSSWWQSTSAALGNGYGYTPFFTF